MKKIYSFLAAFAILAGGCQKQESEADRQAEIERQVQDRLATERQAAEKQTLDQRQTELEARERALAAQENRPAATTAPVSTATPTIRTNAPEPAAERGSYATFYRKLDPYGDWMETGDYGYVFQPRQATQSRDWRPYTHGHWVYTDAGWTWISEEQFGWATYHYGRWIRLRSVGWVWVPGEQWAPAWVSWRRGGEYVGWAPLPPEAQFDRQIGIQNWADNYYDIGPEQYAFVPANEFGRKLTSREIVPTERNVTIINQTTNVTNIVYNNSVVVDRGPSYEDLRSGSRQPIERFRLERTANATDERPVFRGEVVALPTIDFHPTERAARPKRIVRNIPQPVVERGWAGINDAQAVEKARNKMKAEATPPANLPPKRFVRPNLPVNPGNSAPVNVGRPGITPQPSAPASATIAPRATPAATERPARPGKPRPTMTPLPSATPKQTPTSTPERKRPEGKQRQPTSETPAPSVEPTPPTPAENVFSPKEADRNRRQDARAAQEEKRKARQEEQAPAQRRAEREKKIEERRGQKPGRPEASPDITSEQPATTTPPSASEAPAATPAESAAPNAPNKKTADEKRRAKRAEKRAEKRATKAQGQAAESLAPDQSPTPDSQKP